MGLPADVPPPPGPLTAESAEPVRKVGVPSMVLTMGFKSPPRSNSCAEIFRTGVVAPELLREVGVATLDGKCVGEESSTLDDVGVACDTNHESTTWRVAFLKRNICFN